MPTGIYNMGRRRGMFKKGHKISPSLKEKLRIANLNRVGEKSAHWKGGKTISSQGYVLVTTKDGKQVLEHRLVMEKKLKRKLRNDEHVHHINQIKTDNRIKNLQRLTASEHSKLHNHKKRALIFGLTGQDGSYLAEILLDKGYEVFAVVRRCSTFNTQRIDHIRDRITTFYGDLTDPYSIMWALKKSNPDEIYNLAAQSHVQVSWENPYYTAQVTGVGVLNILEGCRVLGLNPRIYQASTSELFSGKEGEAPQSEDTPFHPASPYGTAKLYGLQITRNYREAYGMFICNGILFNHESIRRGDNFVTKKIINAIPKGEVKLGYTGASRDWGYAKEYMEMAWKMLQQDKPDDYVVATGETHTVQDFVDWVSEITGKKMRVILDPTYVRPQDVNCLKGNASKAKEKLGWDAKVKGKSLAEKMIYGDI